MSEELDLYGSNFKLKDVDWKKAVSIFAAVSLVVGVLGFFGVRWMRESTPVSRDQALQMFKEESSQSKADAKASSSKEDHKGASGAQGSANDKDTKDSGSAGSTSGSGSGGGGSSPKNDQTTVAAGTGSKDKRGERGNSAKKAGYEDRRTPEEGVYSWATDGWEEAAGIRREFPEESQRIITASDGESWKQHHYFSEEREIWSEFEISNKGAHLASQRNRAKFGPVTNDSTIVFSPPMLVGLADPEEGAAWNGRWKGRTSGSYTSRIYDHGTMVIGGEKLEVWSYEVRMQMRGELNGTVYAKVTLAPKYALTVHEHYEQTIQTDRGRYRANWTMELKSTSPQN